MSTPTAAAQQLALLPTLLPRSTSSPLPHPTDAVAALIHALHTALGFRMTPQAAGRADGATPTTAPAQPSAAEAAPAEGAGEDADDAASETATAVDDNEEQAESGATEGRLPDNWNARAEDSYTFEYRHEQSSMVFHIRVGRMGGRVQIDGMAENGQPHNLSIMLADLVTPPAFPIPSSATGSSASSSSGEGAAKSIGFKSVSAVQVFIDQYVRTVIARLLPGLSVPGYTEPSAQSGSDPRNPPPSAPSSTPRFHQPPTSPSPLIDPTSAAGGSRFPPAASIGHRDLDPLAAFQPPGSRRPFDPTGGGISAGGGMYMDPSHPLLSGRGRGGAGAGIYDPDFSGPGGMEQPPGARWDPVGPGMGGGPRFPTAGGNPLGGMGVGDDRWGDEMPPPGEFGPDLGRMGGLGGGRGGRGGRGGFGGGLGGMGGLGGGGGRFGGGGGGFGGGGFGGGGGMYM